MSKKLFEKAALVIIPAPQVAGARTDPLRPRTSPGQMAQFLTSQSEAMVEAEALRELVKEFDGALPAKLIDPELITASKWANRIEVSFTTPAYFELKAEIRDAGGNVQPIKVRPYRARASDEEGAPPAFAYEIGFGHRRHRACLELGLPVLAIVEDLSDEDLYIQMERENRGRVDLSPWEQGAMYVRALDSGLFSSNTKLAAAIGADLSNVGKSIALARLPATVIAAFDSPLDLLQRWAPAFKHALQNDPEGILQRARKLAEERKKLKPIEVFELLVGGGGAAPPPPREFSKDGKRVARMTPDAEGRVNIKIEEKLSLAKLNQLAEWIQKFLGSTETSSK